MRQSPLSGILSLPVRTAEPFQLSAEQVSLPREPILSPQQFEPYTKKRAYIICSANSRMRNLLFHFAISSFTQELNESEAISWYMTMINTVIPMEQYPILGSEICYSFSRLFVSSLDDLMKMMANHMDVFQQHFHRFPAGQSHCISTIVMGVLCMFIGKEVTRETYVSWSSRVMERFMNCFRLTMKAIDVAYLPSITSAMHLNNLFRSSCTMRRYVLVAVDVASTLPGRNILSIAITWLKMSRLSHFHLILKYLCADEVHPVLGLPGWGIERIALQNSISKWLTIPKTYRPYTRIIYSDEETGIFCSQALNRPAYAAVLVGRMRNPKLTMFSMAPPRDALAVEKFVLSVEKNELVKEKRKET
ncbi:hypothetical protein TTRE_0000765201 [Trichuris trichiura]|uniref:Uncharacterized protein n=1 Tax=Trichuris trichiura TaxID=36087 RepID=A0A077ZL31_TRITR|nr:hypothetical protein TTRE_0000765201 [Trichuris trichiura]